MLTERSTLTDRYVWAVTRSLPADQIDDVARELRATIADAVDGRLEALPRLDHATVERQIIEEMGAPERLAASYGGRPQMLIGPGLFPEYVALLKVLYPIVLPLALAGYVIANLVDGEASLGAIVGGGAGLVFEVAVHIGFWVTLVFALLDRSRPEEERGRPMQQWSAGSLSAVPQRRQVSWVEAAFGIFFELVLLGLLVDQFGWVNLLPGTIQVLNPDLALHWELALVALTVGLLAREVVKLRTGWWTVSLAATNVALQVASATVLVYLAFGDRLLNADLPAHLHEQFGWGTDWSLPSAIVVVVLAGVCVWDALDGVLKLRQAGRLRAVAAAS